MLEPSRQQHAIADALAAAFLAGAWNERQLAARGSEALQPRPRWMLAVVRAVLAAYREPPHDRPRELATFIAVRLAQRRRTAEPPPPIRVVRRFSPPTAMGRTRWPVAPYPTVGDLAERLELDAGQLAWLADVKGLERSARAERLRNYRYRWLPRAGGPPRLIESPKGRLREIQRLLLREVLEPIPVHDAAHGFVRGRSARTHAAAHTGARIVLRFDVEDFFAGVTAGRVFGVLRGAGYPEPVAHVLTGLCTNVLPATQWRDVPAPADAARVHRHARLGRRLATPHLPQGAPTSPAVANLVAHALDRRLAAYAAACGAVYTRYADDLTFSVDERLERASPRFAEVVARIAREEGFHLNAAKSRRMPTSTRQTVTGIVVNAHPNVARPEYDRLRALLHDAARNGPDAANRAGHPQFRAHVRGRIAWVSALNPARGAKLIAQYEQVRWS